MFKKLILSLMTIFLISGFAFKNVFAVEVKNEKVQVSNIIIKANVPEGFDKNIMINFELKDGTNALYTLNKEQNYIYKGLIPVGQAKLSFASVTPDNGAYNVTLPKEINVEENKSINLDVNVSKVEGYKEPEREFTYDNNDYTKPIEDYGDKYKEKSEVSNKPKEDKSVNKYKNKDVNKENEQKNNQEQKNIENSKEQQNQENSKDKAKEQEQELNKENKEEDNWVLRAIKDNLATIIITIIMIIVIIVLKIKLS